MIGKSSTFFHTNKSLGITIGAILFAGTVLLHSVLDLVQNDNLLMEVPKVGLLSWLEHTYAYLYLHIFTFVPVFLLSFDKKVAYYRKWWALWPAITIVAVLFIIWDVFFTEWGVWGFNDDYLSGIFLFNLPVEEWLFFFTVPFACVFIYECLNAYIKKDLLQNAEPYITPVAIILFLVIGILGWGSIYTFTTFILAAGVLLMHYIWGKPSLRSRFYLAYLVSWFPFMLVNGVLTGGYTKSPIVIYNPEEYLGLRLTSVPIDDSVYSFLMLFSVVIIYEYLLSRRAKTSKS